MHILIIIGIVLTSCTSQKKLTYLQDIDEAGSNNFFELETPDYKIQKQDILFVQFYTINEKVNNLINGATSSSRQMQGESNIYLYGYNVNDSGNVTIPFIGVVEVVGKTIFEAQKIIQEETDKTLKEAVVIVKLLSFKFSVLGEVNSPGMYHNYNNQITILEAISMAGDITDYGNREKVLVIRPEKNGTKTFRINLKTKDVLTSEAFYLLPNDIVIVEPIDSKVFQLNIPTMSFIITSSFSIISTTLLLINYLSK